MCLVAGAIFFAFPSKFGGLQESVILIAGLHFMAFALTGVEHLVFEEELAKFDDDLDRIFDDIVM